VNYLLWIPRGPRIRKMHLKNRGSVTNINFMDIKLPEENGLALLKEIKQSTILKQRFYS
jgi:CheY-like chemotaxis protein